MSDLLLATRNRGKAAEVTEILTPYGWKVQIIDALPAFKDLDVEETGARFVDNALIKAEWALGISGRATIADDSGLVVDVLDGAPGVFSARFAGSEATDEENNNKLVSMLRSYPETERTARFVCSVVLAIPADCSNPPLAVLQRRAQDRLINQVRIGTPVKISGGTAVAWRGSVEGRIVLTPKGANGFGYDPHFYLPSHRMTTAQLPSEEKNRISHRGQAFRAFAQAVASLVP